MSTRIGSWKLLKSRNVYHNPWMDVREDSVIKPDGKDDIFGIVSLKSGVTVIPIDNDGNLYLVEQFRYSLNRRTIEAIGGGIEEGESPVAAAQRELTEETGLVAQNFTDFGTVDPFTTIVNSISHLFLAKNLSIHKSTPDGSENIRVIKTSLNQAIKWVEQGKITHAPSIVLILKLSSTIGAS